MAVRVPLKVGPDGYTPERFQVGDTLPWAIAASLSGCLVSKSANQTIATGTGFTILTFDTEAYDTDAFHAPVTNNSRLTIPSTGYYIFTAQITWGVNSLGFRTLRLYKNGVAAGIGGFSVETVPSATGDQNGVSAVLSCTAGDYFEIGCRQNSGGNLDVLASGGNGTWFAVQRIYSS